MIMQVLFLVNYRYQYHNHFDIQENMPTKIEFHELTET